MSVQEKNIDKLLEIEETRKLQREIYKEIRIKKGNISYFLLAVAASLIISYCISYSYRTEQYFFKCVEILNEVEIAFLGILFTAYSLFQAMMGNEFCVVMSKTKNNLLYKSNRSFLNLILLYANIIIINIIIIISLNMVSEGMLLFDDVMLCSTVCFICIGGYLLYTFMILKEMERFTINLYRMFNSYNAHKIIIEEKKKDENEKNTKEHHL